MQLVRIVGAVAALLLASLGAASAQGFDCTKAQGAIERAICASPQVVLQDQALTNAYAAALARDPDHAADIRQAQRNWLRDRNTNCGKAGDAKATESCLLTAYRQRIAALTPPPASNVAAAAPPATPATAPAQPATPQPAPARSPPRTVTESAPEPLAAAAAPAFAVAASEATLDQTHFPAAERMETLLHVTHAGRFALAARSTTGTALQLVDMLTGPSITMGQAGQSDGRLDTLLDVGTYKLRAFAAPGASGDVSVTVTPFRDAAAAEGAPLRGERDADLADFQQRRFWLTVAPDAHVRIEAAGRALRDLRLWRNGGELATIATAIRTIEPASGHPLTDIVLQGAPEPGTYEVVAYGGAPFAWADGATAMPFHIRSGVSDGLAAGWIAARIGPFGSEMYRAGPAEYGFQLDLPEPATANLAVTPKAPGRFSATIARSQRDPTARIGLPPEATGERVVEVSGAEGQQFQLRTLSGVVARDFVRVGTYWLSIDAFGLGGDEPPLAYVFTRRRGGAPAELVSSSLPRVGPGTAWRAKFNLRGVAGIPFEVTAGGPIVVKTDGVAAQASIAPIGAPGQPRANGATPGTWDLAAGLYILQLQPPRGAAGIVDLTIGAPGVAATPVAPQPLNAALPIGLTTMEGGGRLDLIATSAAGGDLGLLARPAPVDLLAGPLAITLAAGQGIDVPVRLPGDGTLIATELGAGPVPVAFEPVAGPTAGRIGTAHVAAADHIRTVTVAWQPAFTPPPPVPAPETLAPAEALAAETPRFFDLAADTQHGFALNIPSGGLYRVETTGRLHTTGALGTAFIPDLDHADANGVGQNMLLQHFLRAGPYRLVVGAKDSSGHLGVRARPAAIAFGPTLVPGGSVRARMAADSGEIFPIEIAAKGNYHLDLLSQARDLSARLEDEDGWPLLATEDLASIDQEFAPGKYRLLVQPAGVAARIVARLQQITPAVAREGHGPFPLAFDRAQRATWREPAGRDDPRIPDRWDFSLAGPAAVKVSISDGMVAELRGAAPDSPAIARFTHVNNYSGTLPAGAFHLTTMSLGRNDRLDYSVSLSSTEIQPDVPRSVTLPATVPFAIDNERVVNLTSFGRVPLRTVLRRADGGIVERFGDRGDDWNIGISRRLPAGAYRLDLFSAVPPKGDTVTPGDAANNSGNAGNAADNDSDKDADADSDGDSDQAMGDQNAAPESPDQTASNDNAASSDDTSSDDSAKPAPKVELRLALPATRTEVSGSGTGTSELRGGGVHVVALPAVPDQALALVTATSSAELALALERRGADGAWHTLGTTQGNAPVVGGVGDADAAPWRALVWSIDGGSEPIRLSARIVQAEAHPPGTLDPDPVALENFPVALATARVVVPGTTPLSVAGGVAGLRVASPGRPLAPPDGAFIVPQSDRIWLVTMARPGDLALTPVAAPPGWTGLALAVPAGGSAFLPAAPLAPGHTRVWRAESGLGQPGLDSGRGMGVANGSALALAAADLVRVFNAGGADPLRLRVTALDLADQTPRALDGPMAETLPPGSSLPIRLPDGFHRVQFDLAPGTAAIANPRDGGAVTIWSGDTAVSRSAEGSWTDVLLVNTGTAPAPVAVSWTKFAGAPLALAPGVAFKRFYGARGSLAIPVTGAGNFVVVGGDATLIGADHQVSRGNRLAVRDGGEIVIDHGPGLLATWIETPEKSPWPAPVPKTVSLPARIPMQDMAMALKFSAPSEMLLHVRSTSPLILALGSQPPTLHPQGAEMNLAVAAGDAELHIISPHDGALSGTVEISADPITPARDGVGAPVALAPGGTAAFGFSVARAGPIGVGVRAEPDRIFVRLLNDAGTTLGEGVAQLQILKPGHYMLEAQIPPDGATTLVRPTIVGIAPRPNGPPPDVVNQYLALAGRAPVPVIPVSAHAP